MNQGTQSTNPKLNLRSYAMSNNDKEVTDRPIKTLHELKALAHRWRRNEYVESEVRSPSLQAVHGSPPKVLSGDEVNEEKRFYDDINKASIARKRYDNKQAKFGAILNQYQEKVNSCAARSHHPPCNRDCKDDVDVNEVKGSPRKTSEMAANLAYKTPPAAAVEIESLPKLHEKEISMARPRISTRHFTECVEEASSLLSSSREAEHCSRSMYPSPITTSDGSEANFMTMKEMRLEPKQGKDKEDRIEPPSETVRHAVITGEDMLSRGSLYSAISAGRARGHHTYIASERPTRDLTTPNLLTLTGRGRWNSQKYPGPTAVRPSVVPTAPTGGRAFHRGSVKSGTQRNSRQVQVFSLSGNDGSGEAANEGSSARRIGRGFARGRRERAVLTLHTRSMSSDEKPE